ncbi:unnamed protein product [Peronospora effusa]|nr:unnamed protein product [Peronospora effusa]
MAQAPQPTLPQPTLPQHYQPPPVYHPNALQQFLPGPRLDRVPDTRQRKLGIRPFDGKELYQGLGSDFLSWGKLSVRKIQFAESACGFT